MRTFWPPSGKLSAALTRSAADTASKRWFQRRLIPALKNGRAAYSLMNDYYIADS
jgi:hypothetical protein